MIHTNKIMSLFFLLFIFTVYCAPVRVENPVKVQSKSTLNVHSGPGVNYKVITSVPEGTDLILLDVKDDWQKVQLRNGKTGWIYKGFTEEKMFEEIQIINQTYIRKGPGELFEPFAVLRKGYKFQKIGEKGGWYSVVLPDGNSGWIPKSDAKRISQKSIVTTTNTVLREMPDENSKQIVRLVKGQELIQLKKANSWYYVQVAEGMRGWIPERAVIQTAERNISVPVEANIRRGPDQRYGIIETVSANERLTELERHNNWIKVRTPSGNVGWVFQQVVQTQQATTSQSAQYAISPEFVVTNRECNIRQGYSTSFRVLTRAKEGTVLLKIGQRDNWYRIKFPPNGNIGWIRNDLVDRNREIGITRKECNIRQGYNTSFRVKRRVPAGTPLARISSRDEWYRVYMPDGEIGWIRGDLASDHRNILITNQACNVRQGPGTNWKKINRLQAGEIVTRSRKEDEWFRVLQPNDNYGWIREDLLVTLVGQLETDDNTNIRQGPGTNHELVTQVQPKTKLYQIGSQANWLEIRLASGSKGWVREDLVTPAYPGVKPSTISAEVYMPTSKTSLMTIQKTNIRIGPGLNYAILQRVEAGTELIKLSQQGEWYEVQLPDGNIGYVHDSVFDRTGDIQPMQQLIKGKLYTSNAATVWKMPDSTSSVLTQLPAGEEISKIDQRDDWVYVDLSNGKKGWLPSAFVSTERQLRPTFSTNDIVIEYGTLRTKDNVEIRENPTILDQVIKKVPKDYRLTKMGSFEDWYRVQINKNQVGWVKATSVEDITINMMITVAKAPVKQMPGDQHRTIKELPVGTTVMPQEKFDNWYAIRTGSGESGWIDEGKVTELKFPVFFASDNSRVRTTPYINDNILTTLEGGTEVQPTAEKNDWYFVRLPDGRRGWMSKSVVTKQYLPRIRITKTAKAYKKPSIRSGTISTLKKGDEFYPVAKQGEWYKIILVGGDFGWIYSSFYEEIVSRNLLVKTNSNIREGPGFEYKIVGLARQGEELKCLDEQDSWCQVRTASGKIGWVKSDLTRGLPYRSLITIKQTPVRTGPGMNYANIATFKPNTRFTPIDERNGWFQVKLSDSKKGWINKADCVKQSKSRYVFTLDLSNIRSGPGTTYEVLTRVDPATDLMVIGESGDWYNVKLVTEGIIGWIKKELVFE